MGIGTFTSTISGLIKGNTYYIRAYATNAAGTAYGNQLSFVAATIPTLSTVNVSKISPFKTLSGITINNNGGSPIISYGLCWDSVQNPTILSKHSTLNSNLIGTDEDTIQGLIPNKIYYVRAYAINSAGVAYGNEISFNSGINFGTTYQGGLVIYNDGFGHGLVASATNQSNGVQWYNGTNVSTGANATSIGNGNANTNAIVATQGAGNYAAKICFDLVQNGFSDWYLPCQDELALFKYYSQFGTTISGGDYWSSSENGNTYAYSNSYGTLQSSPKNSLKLVRAIRSF